MWRSSAAAPGPQIILSRTHAEFVRKILELEVPEIYDKTVDVFKIVREPGYRTKIAVFSHREDIDPVGACVGLKGIRIQAIIRELEGEKVDILKYEVDSKRFHPQRPLARPRSGISISSTRPSTSPSPSSPRASSRWR